MDKKSYAMGMSIAHNLVQSGVKELTFEDFISGLKDTMQGNQPQVSFEEAGKILEAFFKEVEEKAAAEKELIGGQMKEEGAKFLEQNAKNEGVITLESGLQYKVIKEGEGKKPKATDTVKCHYEGTFISGQKFDSSFDRNQPATFGLNQVIKGWTEGLQLMSEGSEYMLYIPYNLAYGESGSHGAIPPYSTLVFRVQLLEVQ